MKPIFIIGLLLFPLCCMAQWSTNSAVNTAVFNATGCMDDSLENARAVIVTDAVGNSFCTWSDNRSGTKNVYVQKFNAAGVAQWTVNGIRIAATAGYQIGARVVADNAGGCVVVWADSTESVTRYNIKAQKLNAVGTSQWTEGGIVLCNAANNQLNPRIINDGGGGYYVSWYDERVLAGVGSIYLQRINGSGVSQFTANGIVINNSVVLFPEQHFLLKENTNAIIVYSHYNGNNFDIKAQKINDAGVAQWIATGLNVIASNNEEAYFDAAVDNTGNLFVAWESYSPPNYDVGNIYVQKINSSGVLQWTPNGVVGSTAVNDQYWPAVAPDNAGGALVAWEDYSKDPTNVMSDIFVQKYNSNGSAAFKTNGIAVCDAPNSQYTPRIVSDGNGGAIICFTDERNGGIPDIYVQRINSNGTMPWPVNGIAIANAVNTQKGADMVVANNGVVAGFYDDRTTLLCFNYFLQRINLDGTLGELTTSVTDLNPLKDKLKVYPTLMQHSLWIDNQNAFSVEMRIIDIQGRVVLIKTLSPQSRTLINVTPLVSGIYWSDFLLKEGRRVKVVLMKQ
jgi:hypothetical protein